MTLNREPRTVRRRVKALEDAKPSKVSLVKAGANKTPFRVVKDDGSVEIAALPTADLTDANYDIAYITFDARAYDEPKIEDWLKDGGYSDYRIQKDEGAGTFIVTPEGVDIAELAVRGAVTLRDGITVHILSQDKAQKEDEKTAPPDPEAAPVQPVAISMEEASKKFDSYSAQAGWNGKSLREVLENSSWDGLPLGIYDLTQALYGAVKANFRDGSLDGIRSAVNEYGDKLTALAALFPHPKLPDDLGLALKGDASIPDYDRAALVAHLAPDFAPTQTLKTEGDGAMPKDIKDAAEAEATSQKAAFKACADYKTGEACTKAGACGAEKTAKKDEAGAGETPPVETEDKKDAAEGETPAQKTEGSVTAGSEDANVPAWARALFEPLAKSVGDLAKTVEAGFAQSAQKADALEQRVTSVEEGSASSRQTRKGADVEDATAGSTEDAERRKKADEFDAWNRRGLLGIRNSTV